MAPSDVPLFTRIMLHSSSAFPSIYPFIARISAGMKKGFADQSADKQQQDGNDNA